MVKSCILVVLALYLGQAGLNKCVILPHFRVISWHTRGCSSRNSQCSLVSRFRAPTDPLTSCLGQLSTWVPVVVYPWVYGCIAKYKPRVDPCTHTHGYPASHTRVFGGFFPPFGAHLGLIWASFGPFWSKFD